MLVVLPIIFGVTAYKTRGQLSLPVIQAKFGTLYVGIRHYKTVQILYSSFFLLKRLTFALVLVLLEGKPLLVVFSLLQLNVLDVSYICTAVPYNSIYEKRVYLMNQIFMQLVLYHLLLNTFQVRADADWLIGYSLIGTIGAMIAVNLLMIGFTTIKGVFTNFKLKGKKRAKIKARQELNQRRIDDAIS